MRIRNHRLCDDEGNPLAFQDSPNKSAGSITPEYLVLHYTASGSAEGAISWLCNPQAQASAHLVIARDGTVTQLVAFNRKAWHAGRSRWAGRSGVNGFSIGIELDNPGILKRRGEGWCNEWGAPVETDDVIEAAHRNGGPVCGWHAYPEVQLEVALEVAALLVAHYGLKDVVGHEDVAPNRKVDPGPAFPLRSFRAAALGRSDDEPEVFRTTTALNIRSGPGTEHPTLAFAPLAEGTRVELADEAGVWRLVEVLDPIEGEVEPEGWVHGRYLAPV